MNPVRIRHFWDWFRARAEKVRGNPEHYAEEIGEMLDRVQEGLGWEMGGPREGPSDFTIRTESPELRHVTHEIVRGAPEMPGWRITSWRLPMETRGFKIQVGQGKSFALEKFSADLSEDPDHPFLHLVLATPEFSAKPSDSETYAGYLALDAVLGEKQVEDAVDSIEFRRGPTGKIPAARLREEVERRLAALRGRPRPARTDQWAMMEGKSDGKVMLAMVATGLGSSLVETHPWRVDLRLTLHEPHENGIATSEELQAIRPVEDRFVEIVESGGAGVVWTHRTHDGGRTTSFYVQEPGGLGEVLRAVARDADYDSEAVIDYDSRWREYREFVRPADHPGG